MSSGPSFDRPAPAPRRPAEADDSTVAAVGKLTEALETTERARGHLYAFHQLTGGADAQLDAVVDLLREAGRHALAEQVAVELIGRNVLPGRWTYQIVEEYDDDYYRTFRSLEARVREQLLAGRRHVAEAEMKERRRTHGHEAHRATPRTAPPEGPDGEGY
ncbi:hypothetical protein RM572_25820 [Streptomyces sp. DSM 42041]|uniref:Uncharacterized protein n=1 Tax=Streptomyces hazeniae TaxID=3075538 RepID=A0ABU2NYX4_9ACTN|nr:hypothetical protein [Streptomyces sp. DSM 42041]MDT0382183.1 hypothetical protein [Streptomyces sp. DSM 42041]